MQYNTQLDKLLMPEYGRAIQQMVEHCKSLNDRSDRQRCAELIIRVMSTMAEGDLRRDELKVKLWNHLAAIANYELDIDYPVAIEQQDETFKPQPIPYPQKKIQLRHYGAIVEKFAKLIPETEVEDDRKALSLLLANHMKRDLSNWNIDSMSDQKVAYDLASYTDGKVQIDLDEATLISDGELLSTLVSTSVKKRKRK